MFGSWRLNVGFGGFGAGLTLLFSIANNPVETTFLRCVYAFLAFFALGFAVRFLLGQLLAPARKPVEPDSAGEPGSTLDMTTPDEGDELTLLMKEQWADGNNEPSAGFQPLQPKRLVSVDHPDPEDVVQAIRLMKDER